GCLMQPPLRHCDSEVSPPSAAHLGAVRVRPPQLGEAAKVPEVKVARLRVGPASGATAPRGRSGPPGARLLSTHRGRFRADADGGVSLLPGLVGREGRSLPGKEAGRLAAECGEAGGGPQAPGQVHRAWTAALTRLSTQDRSGGRPPRK